MCAAHVAHGDVFLPSPRHALGTRIEAVTAARCVLLIRRSSARPEPIDGETAL